MLCYFGNVKTRVRWADWGRNASFTLSVGGFIVMKSLDKFGKQFSI